jgi:enoyl-CoA hydratase
VNQLILYEKSDNIGIITINRPEKVNAMNQDIISGLTELLTKLNDDQSIRGVIITGTGKSFSSGVDISLMQVNPEEGREFIKQLHGMINAARYNRKPIIAAINGYCFGGALEFILACDMCVAADNATFGMQEVNLGIPSVIEAALFPFAVGLVKTRELLLTGKVITAEEALKINLINRVVPRDSLLDEAKKAMKEIIRNSPYVVGLQKELINRWLANAGIEESIKIGADYFTISLTNENTRDSLNSALKK